MRRRDFGGSLAAGAVGFAPSAAGSAATPRKNTLMHVGADYHSDAGRGITSKANLEHNLRYGVKPATAQGRKRPGGAWSAHDPTIMPYARDPHHIVFATI